jgi:tetratricopeptide (TPR) repeat protein
LARSKPDTRQATEALHEIESVFDRLATWVTSNPRAVLGVLGAILAVAAVANVWVLQQHRRAERASAAMAEVESDYLRAMGAAPGALEVSEPANPETALRVRTEFSERFLATAEEHAGTASAVAALLQAAQLQAELGRPEDAAATWRRAADEAPGGSALRGLALTRLARGLEAAGRWPEAAAAYAEAGAIAKLPTRRLALADAARAYAQAGETERALELFDRAEALDGPELPLHVKIRLEELRAARAQQEVLAPAPDAAPAP